MSSPEDRPAPAGEPVPPRWDAPPQPPAWDRPVGAQQNWGPPPPYAQHPGYAQPGYGAYAPPLPNEGKAVAGLVLAILSWVALPVIGAIIALVLAGMSGREIAASGGRLGGAGLNTATTWVAWLNLGLWGLLAVFVVGAFALFASSSTGFS